MHDEFKLDEVDPNGVVPEAEQATGQTRRGFLRKTAIVGGTAIGGSTILAAFPAIARAGHGDSVADADVLNYALTLEYLEATFYTQALGGQGAPADMVPSSPVKFGRGAITKSKLFAGFGGRIRSGAYSNLITIRDHEVTHVKFLRAGIKAAGATPVDACSFNFSSALKSVGSFIATARVLENTGVMAYDGAIRYVDTGDFLQAGAQIATVEARHAAYLNLISRGSPFPAPFDSGKKPSEIFAAAKPFISSCPPPVLALFSRLP
ncbi:MAG: ferritin-like domain-containing protein [Actinobacteria bacterium]|nr:ferritin-like domain-containing protein [Actinomycetota bacterium]